MPAPVQFAPKQKTIEYSDLALTIKKIIDSEKLNVADPDTKFGFNRDTYKAATKCRDCKSIDALLKKVGDTTGTFIYPGHYDAILVVLIGMGLMHRSAMYYLFTDYGYTVPDEMKTVVQNVIDSESSMLIVKSSIKLINSSTNPITRVVSSPSFSFGGPSASADAKTNPLDASSASITSPSVIPQKPSNISSLFPTSQPGQSSLPPIAPPQTVPIVPPGGMIACAYGLRANGFDPVKVVARATAFGTIDPSAKDSKNSIRDFLARLGDITLLTRAECEDLFLYSDPKNLADEIVARLLLIGFPLDELSIPDKKTALGTVRASYMSVPMLRSLGYTPSVIQDKGFTAEECTVREDSAPEYIRSGLPVKELRERGYSDEFLKSIGFSDQEFGIDLKVSLTLYTCGYNCFELLARGYPKKVLDTVFPPNMTAVDGVTKYAALRCGLSIEYIQLVLIRYLKDQLKVNSDGLGDMICKAHGYSPEDIQAAVDKQTKGDSKLDDILTSAEPLVKYLVAGGIGVARARALLEAYSKAAIDAYEKEIEKKTHLDPDFKTSGFIEALVKKDYGLICRPVSRLRKLGLMPCVIRKFPFLVFTNSEEVPMNLVSDFDKVPDATRDAFFSDVRNGNLFRKIGFSETEIEPGGISNPSFWTAGLNKDVLSLLGYPGILAGLGSDGFASFTDFKSATDAYKDDGKLKAKTWEYLLGNRKTAKEVEEYAQAEANAKKEEKTGATPQDAGQEEEEIDAIHQDAGQEEEEGDDEEGDDDDESAAATPQLVVPEAAIETKRAEATLQSVAPTGDGKATPQTAPTFATVARSKKNQGKQQIKPASRIQPA